MRSVTLKTGENVPVFGLGTWHMGEDRRSGRPRWRPSSWGSSSASP